MSAGQAAGDMRLMSDRLLMVHEAARRCVVESAREYGPALGRVLQLDLDNKAWEDRLADRPEIELLAKARRELAVAVYAASAGLYLQAYATLRVFLELSCASIYFSANEFERRRWLNERSRFAFASAVDGENGVLSPAFVGEFYSDAAADAPAFAETARSVYDRCSGFVHGRSGITQALPLTLTYSSEALDDWAKSARQAAEVVLYLLHCRYSDQLRPASDPRLMGTLMYSFSHLPSIRRTLGLGSEERIDNE